MPKFVAIQAIYTVTLSASRSNFNQRICLKAASWSDVLTKCRNLILKTKHPEKSRTT